jgi:hypothetical protein
VRTCGWSICTGGSSTDPAVSRCDSAGLAATGDELVEPLPPVAMSNVPDRERDKTLRNTFACEMDRMKGGSAA